MAKVIASDVTCRRMLVLPQDAEHLGIEPDEMEIADAVRMSMSIPLFFEPVVHKDPGRRAARDRGRRNAVQLPGGCSTAASASRWPTFGLLLVEPEPRKPIDTGCGARTTVQGAGRSSTTSGARADDDGGTRPPLPGQGDVARRSIPARRRNHGVRDRPSGSVRSGHKAASEFLDAWDFGAYIEEFRRGKHHSRREDVLATGGESR